VPPEEAHRFGILKADRRGRVEIFQEKPAEPLSNQANLGIYVFKRSVLEERLNADAENPNSSHDFGKDILPRMVEECDCYTYEFHRYWRDVGTLQSYWEANMECLTPRLGLDLREWGVHTNWHEIPLEYQMPCHVYGEGQIVNSIVGKGSSIRGSVVNSVLFRGVEVGPGAEVHDSIIMDGAKIGAGAKVRHLIADKHAEIGPNSVIGDGNGDSPANKETPDYLYSGLTLMGMYTRMPENYNVGRNVLIYPDLSPEDFPADRLDHGETVRCAKSALKNRQ
ncbi:MAG: sugar phosphate nucleotidyltransferase, partial [Candidatus Sumerlaeota bacterium]